MSLNLIDSSTNEILFVSDADNARDGALQSWSAKKFLDVRDPFLRGWPRTDPNPPPEDIYIKYNIRFADIKEWPHEHIPPDDVLVKTWAGEMYGIIELIIHDDNFEHKNEPEEKQWEEMIKTLNAMFENWKRENTEIVTSYDYNLAQWATDNLEQLKKLLSEEMLRLMLLRGFYVEIAAKLEKAKDSIRKKANILFTLKKEDGFFNGVVESKESKSLKFNFDSY